MRLIIFGSSVTARVMYKSYYQDQDVIAWADNNSSRWGTFLYDIPICRPEQCLLEMEYDQLIIGVLGAFDEVLQQCLDMGIPRSKIVTSHMDRMLMPRKSFLSNLSTVLNGYERDAAVAEGGVYQGDFAKWINTCFPDRTLHLFDTFEGFDERDIPIELEKNFSTPKAGHFSKTSVDFVLSRMPHPDRCKIHKGYFPDSAAGITDKFCFVNLDFDLYNPIYAGLCFFKDKITEHGVILVHDYWGKEYGGTTAAVDRFLTECGGSLMKYPIGDGVSVMITGQWG